ncbi:MAG: hypothetical protein JNL64_14635 [Blastocatellia bacterium]|nr:hypothetical protein [Blastocatellia bacterium]
MRFLLSHFLIMAITHSQAQELRETIANNILDDIRFRAVHGLAIGQKDGSDSEDSFFLQVWIDPATETIVGLLELIGLLNSADSLGVKIVFAAQCEALNIDSEARKVFTAPRTPLRPGSSISSNILIGGKGTLGYFCIPRDGNDCFLNGCTNPSGVHLLSNAHVLSILGVVPDKDTKKVVHPARGDNGTIPVANLCGRSDITVGKGKNVRNSSDGAYAVLLKPDLYSSEVPVIFANVSGKVAAANIKKGLDCQKVGIGSGKTNGRIYTPDMLVKVNYKYIGSHAWFSKQIVIENSQRTGSFCVGGDSGSLVVDRKNNAIGLLFAGAEKLKDLEGNKASALLELVARGKADVVYDYGVATYIETVENDLKVDLMIFPN